MKKQRPLFGFVAALSVVPILLLSLLLLFSATGSPVYASPDGEFPHATVKVWDTAVAIPPSLTLGLTPGESVEDPTGLTGHGTSYPTIVTVYANGSHPGGPSGLSYWNPDGNLFVWYGKTLGFPSGVDMNKGGGPVLAGGPVDPGPDGLLGTPDDLSTSFGPGDVWVAGQQIELVYVHIAGTNMFRTYGVSNPFEVNGKRAWGIEVDETTGRIFIAEPEDGRIARLDPVTGGTKVWLFGGNPAYITVDSAGRPYATLSAADAIIRVNSDDTATVWRVPNVNGIEPSFRKVPHAGAQAGAAGDNANGIITADADGNIWFLETNSNEVGRLSGGPDALLGTADDEICEFTKPGLLNPQQIATTGSGNQLQAYFTEGDGDSVSVLTQVEADLALPPTRICTPVPAEPFFPSVFEAAASFFDEKVEPFRTPIVPTVHDVPGLDGAASGATTTADGKPIPPILRFSPMPNPILSSDGTPIGDAGNGFPSGLTGIYAANRIAGAYLKGNKHFEVTSGAIIARPSPPSNGTTGRMTGGGSVFTADGRRVTHGFVLQCIPEQKRNNVLQVRWQDGNQFRLGSVTAASCSDDPAIEPNPPSAGFDTHSGAGTGRYNGAAGAMVEWTFTDAGKPGTSDAARIVIKDAFGVTVLDVSGTLRKGNHQAHNE